MNIKEHIEAGHYPKDEKGRALVPVAAGRIATILSVDGPEGEEIIGVQGDNRQYVTTWNWRGLFTTKEDDLTLLPTSPRKVKVVGWALIVNGEVAGIRDTYDGVVEKWQRGCMSSDQVIELTGEYEEPWS